MNIERFNNLLSILNVWRKSEVSASSKSNQAKAAEAASVSGPSGEQDSVSISQEGLVKETTMNIKAELDSVRENKIAEITRRIESGEYKVDPREIARSILNGRDVYEELK